MTSPLVRHPNRTRRTCRGLISVSAVIIARPVFIPYGLAFAAGAMLYVVFDEMIPESHRKGHKREATLGGIVGFGLMVVLDTIFA